MEGCFELSEKNAYGKCDVHSLSEFPLVRSWVIAKYGSVQLQQSKMLLFDGVDKLQYDTVLFIPAIARIVEEYLLKVARTTGVTKVGIGFTNGMFSVQHNGNCIPVAMDREVGKYKPRVIFESEIHEWEEKFKACNPDLIAPTVEQIIFMLSSSREIQINDANLKIQYEFTSSKDWKETARQYRAKKNSTKVEFQFHLIPNYDEEAFHKIMKTRAIEIQATIGNELNIQFNGQNLDVARSFSEYVDMYPKKVLESRAEALPRFCKKLNDRLEVCVTRSDGIFEQESFVNGTRTIAGGTIVELLVEKVESHARTTGINFKNDEIRNSMMMFINFSIDNPQFSLSNDCLNSELDGVLLSNLSNDDLDHCVRNITRISQKQNDITSDCLDDAEKAGSEESRECTLILCEGASAAKFVRSGLSYLGRDYHGILTLQGKPPNAFGSFDKVVKNVDLKNIVGALGLDVGVHYNNTNFLRYGHLMLMADQDVDGSHIKGLLISFLAKHWPSLLKIDGFLSQFVTPVVKAQVNGQPHDFYSTLEFDMFWQSHDKDGIQDVRYFKGLATHTDEDGKDYFTNKVQHNKIFKWCGQMDYNAIELAFSPERANERKVWIKKMMNFIVTQPQRVLLDMKDAKYVSYHDFIHKELVHYSASDVRRSIPSFVDGLKPSQRKVLYAAFAGGLECETENRVYQFSGYVCKITAYHHGGTNMENTIIGMAQNFVGKNNINLLEPKGQFGSRIEGTEENAAARYLHIQLGKFAKLIFRNEDESFLSFLHEDGMSVEPRWYLPVLPMCIVNGCQGVATGWSTTVPMFDPKIIIQNILILLKKEKKLVNSEKLIPMRPHYVGFKGEVVEDPEETGVFIISGVINNINDTEIEITDLPPTQTVSEYREFLLSLTLKPEPKGIVKSFQELHEERSIKFKVKFWDSQKLIEAKGNGGLLIYFKLVSQISTRNMNLVDHNGVVVKFDSAEEIIRHFVDMRLPYYAERKELLLAQMKKSMAIVDNKIRYLKEVRNHEIDIMDDNLVAKLNETGYNLIEGDKDFGHLLKITLSDLRTMDIETLSTLKHGLVDEFAKLEKASGVDLWIDDLEELSKALGIDLEALWKALGIAPLAVAASASTSSDATVQNTKE